MLVEDLEFRLRADVSKALPQLLKVQEELKKTMRQYTMTIKSMEDNSDKIMNSMKKLASAMVVKKVVTDSIKYIGNMEQQLMSFTVKIGSTTKATKLYTELIQLAAKTPLQLPEVTQSANQMLAYGTALKDVVGMVRMLGDVSSGVGARLEDVTWVYGTMQATGRVVLRDLYQLGTRGIPVLQELAKNLKVTTGDVLRMTSSGAIGLDDLENAFKTMTQEGGMFHDMLEKQSKTLLGLYSTLVDTANLAAADMFGPLSRSLKGLTKELIKFIENNKVLIQMMGMLFDSTLGVAIDGIKGFISVFNGLPGVVRILIGLGVQALITVTSIKLLLVVLAKLVMGYQAATKSVAAFYGVNSLNNAGLVKSAASAVANNVAIAQTGLASSVAGVKFALFGKTAAGVGPGLAIAASRAGAATGRFAILAGSLAAGGKALLSFGLKFAGVLGGVILFRDIISDLGLQVAKLITGMSDLDLARIVQEMPDWLATVLGIDKTKYAIEDLNEEMRTTTEIMEDMINKYSQDYDKTLGMIFRGQTTEGNMSYDFKERKNPGEERASGWTRDEFLIRMKAYEDAIDKVRFKTTALYGELGTPRKENISSVKNGISNANGPSNTYSMTTEEVRNAIQAGNVMREVEAKEASLARTYLLEAAKKRIEYLQEEESYKGEYIKKMQEINVQENAIMNDERARAKEQAELSGVVRGLEKKDIEMQMRVIDSYYALAKAKRLSEVKSSARSFSAKAMEDFYESSAEPGAALKGQMVANEEAHAKRLEDLEKEAKVFVEWGIWSTKEVERQKDTIDKIYDQKKYEIERQNMLEMKEMAADLTETEVDNIELKYDKELEAIRRLGATEDQMSKKRLQKNIDMIKKEFEERRAAIEKEYDSKIKNAEYSGDPVKILNVEFAKQDSLSKADREERIKLLEADKKSQEDRRKAADAIRSSGNVSDYTAMPVYAEAKSKYATVKANYEKAQATRVSKGYVNMLEGPLAALLQSKKDELEKAKKFVPLSNLSPDAKNRSIESNKERVVGIEKEIVALQGAYDAQVALNVSYRSNKAALDALAPAEVLAKAQMEDMSKVVKQASDDYSSADAKIKELDSSISNAKAAVEELSEEERSYRQQLREQAELDRVTWLKNKRDTTNAYDLLKANQDLSSFKPTGGIIDSVLGYAGQMGNVAGANVISSGSATQMGTMLGGGDILAAAGGPIGMFIQALVEAMMSLENVMKILNFINTIVEGMMSVLGPLINQILQPIVDILFEVGVALGDMLTPIFAVVAIVTTFIAIFGKLFVIILRLIAGPLKMVAAVIIDYIVNPMIRTANAFIDGWNNTLGKLFGTIKRMDEIDLYGESLETLKEKLNSLAKTIDNAIKSIEETMSSLVDEVKDRMGKELSSIANLYKIGAINATEMESRSKTVRDTYIKGIMDSLGQSQTEAMKTLGMNIHGGKTLADIWLELKTLNSDNQVLTELATRLEVLKKTSDKSEYNKVRDEISAWLRNKTLSGGSAISLAEIIASMGVTLPVIKTLSDEDKKAVEEASVGGGGRGRRDGEDGFAIGSAYVQSDMTAGIHTGEMIIPRSFADSVRAGEVSIGGGNQPIVVNVYGSVMEENNLADTIAKKIDQRRKRGYVTA